MVNKSRAILAAGLIAATSGWYDDNQIPVDESRLGSTKNLETEVVSSNELASLNIDSLHYSGFVGRSMGVFDTETGLKGTLKFNILLGGDQYVLTKKIFWQNEVRGKTVPVRSEVDFYARVETPRVLDNFITATLFDNEWYVTYIELSRKTSGNSPAFKRAEEIYLDCLEALETPIINGRPRVAMIVDGGI